jgi:hypothetical protein
MKEERTTIEKEKEGRSVNTCKSSSKMACSYCNAFLAIDIRFGFNEGWIPLCPGWLPGATWPWPCPCPWLWPLGLRSEGGEE